MTAQAEAWRYRDYVIRSFNEDKPYDQFVREQLAGDELDRSPPRRSSPPASTGWASGTTSRPIQLQATFDELDDILGTTGQAFLGLTVNCARCHDHKFDPFPQNDYYRLLAFFRGIERYAGTSVAAAHRLPADSNADRLVGWPKFRSGTLRYEEIAELKSSVGRRTSKAGESATISSRENRMARRHACAFPERHFDEETMARYEVLRQRARMLETISQPWRRRHVSRKRRRLRRDTFILVRGNPRGRRTGNVTPGFPTVMATRGAGNSAAPRRAANAGRRKVLANWIASADNPLTARVHGQPVLALSLWPGDRPLAERFRFRRRRRRRIRNCSTGLPANSSTAAGG